MALLTVLLLRAGGVSAAAEGPPAKRRQKKPASDGMKWTMVRMPWEAPSLEEAQIPQQGNPNSKDIETGLRFTLKRMFVKPTLVTIITFGVWLVGPLSLFPTGMCFGRR